MTQRRGFLAEQGITSAGEVRREHVDSFTSHILGKRLAATASVRFRAIQPFLRLLVDDEHLDTDRMAKMKVPFVPRNPYPSSPRPI